MRKLYYLLCVKHWTPKEKDRWLAQKGLGLAMLASLIYLAVGCNTFGRGY